MQHNRKCITIFSAPNYCDAVGNKGAILVFDPIDEKRHFRVAGRGDGGGEVFQENSTTTNNNVVNNVAATSSASSEAKLEVAVDVDWLMSDLRPKIIEFAASPHPKKDKQSLNEKLAQMGLVPRAFPF